MESYFLVEGLRFRMKRTDVTRQGSSSPAIIYRTAVWNGFENDTLLHVRGTPRTRLRVLCQASVLSRSAGGERYKNLPS